MQFSVLARRGYIDSSRRNSQTLGPVSCPAQHPAGCLGGSGGSRPATSCRPAESRMMFVPHRPAATLHRKCQWKPDWALLSFESPYKNKNYCTSGRKQVHPLKCSTEGLIHDIGIFSLHAALKVAPASHILAIFASTSHDEVNIFCSITANESDTFPIYIGLLYASLSPCDSCCFHVEIEGLPFVEPKQE